MLLPPCSTGAGLCRASITIVSHPATLDSQSLSCVHDMTSIRHSVTRGACLSLSVSLSLTHSHPTCCRRSGCCHSDEDRATSLSQIRLATTKIDETHHQRPSHVCSAATYSGRRAPRAREMQLQGRMGCPMAAGCHGEDVVW